MYKHPELYKKAQDKRAKRDAESGDATQSGLKKEVGEVTDTQRANVIKQNKKMHNPDPEQKKKVQQWVNKAAKSLTKTKPGEYDDLDDPINEVSATTLANYTAKARKQSTELASHADTGEYRDMASNIIDKRKRGQALAGIKSQGRHGVVAATHTPLPESAVTEGKHYYAVVGTTDASLRKDFGMRKDATGWYLSEDADKTKLLEAQRAFGKPLS
jgi:hypothetical protein